MGQGSPVALVGGCPGTATVRGIVEHAAEVALSIHEVALLFPSVHIPKRLLYKTQVNESPEHTATDYKAINITSFNDTWNNSLLGDGTWVAFILYYYFLYF